MTKFVIGSGLFVGAVCCGWFAACLRSAERPRKPSSVIVFKTAIEPVRVEDYF
jgi:hypothetical protein